MEVGITEQDSPKGLDINLSGLEHVHMAEQHGLFLLDGCDAVTYVKEQHHHGTQGAGRHRETH
jgi:hypothetical protein